MMVSKLACTFCDNDPATETTVIVPNAAGDDAIIRTVEVCVVCASALEERIENNHGDEVNVS
jgi:hypothetical protein